MTNEQPAPRSVPKQLAAAVLSGLLAFPPGSIGFAWAGEPTKVDGISVFGDKVQVNMSSDARYTSRVTAVPPRLILDVAGAQYKVEGKVFPGQGRYVKGVRASQYQPSPELVSRIVVDLSEMTSYQITKNDMGLLVVVGPADGAKPEAGGPSADLPKPKVGETGGMTTETTPELNEMAQKSDAAPRAGSDDGAPPPQPSQSAERSNKITVGHIDIMTHLPHDLVSLDFDNTDIKDVIKLLSAKAKVNIIYGPDVAGSLSLHLNDVPFDEAFRTILTMMSLSTSQVGENILRILTPATLAKTQSADATATKVITLNYSKALDILPAVTSVRSAEKRSGTAIADPKTNSLIVTESIEGLAKTELLISQLDQRPKQVLIEAKLVEVALNNSLDFGVQWDYLSVEPGKIGGKGGTNIIGGTGAPSTIVPGQLDILANQTYTSGSGATGRGTGVQLPADKIFGALTLGRITNNYFLNLSLTAAAAEGKVKVLSDPKIATLNNQAANINVTTQIPYVTSNATANTVTQAVTYVTVGIQLSVTPTINADGRITLNINPVVSQPSASAAASAGGAPVVDSRNATTTVMVKDGETIVIGGLISDTVSNQIAKIPILGDIPILGWLFKKKTVIRNRTELLIFVTPKIMND